MNGNHAWKLVAPWYHWQRQLAAEGRKPAQTRPVFQKFDQPDFVKSFTRDPQHSLVFKPDVDRVFKTVLTDAPPAKSGSPFSGRFTRLYAPKNEQGIVVAKDAALVPTGVLKLYLPTHKRFYLVVCELHCDAPGFPTVTPNQVCQAGFIVRRRSFNFPGGTKKEAVKILQRISAVQNEIAYWEQTAPAKGQAARRRTQAVQKAMTAGTYNSNLAGLRSQLDPLRQELVQWKDANGVVPILEGWLPGPFENIGAWQIVEEQPAQIVDSIFPLYPLFPDPLLPEHSAHGRTIYFGVVPTSSLDTDERGNARFDAQSLYEIRCFVRRHKTDCPRLDQAPDCPGELVWGEPTEVYKLAAPSDLIGTSQHPVTIPIPDLAELAAQAATLDVSKLAPVKFVQPQAFNFGVNDGKGENGSIGGFQICFFAIPLITIVAMFLLKLFLPIVVFLFGLFFLLQLKFCIPPSVAINAGLDAELKAIPPSLDVDADFSISIELPSGTKQLTDELLQTDLRGAIVAEAGVTVTTEANQQLGKFSNRAFLPAGLSIAAANSQQAAMAGPDLTGALEFEPRLEVTIK